MSVKETLPDAVTDSETEFDWDAEEDAVMEPDTCCEMDRLPLLLTVVLPLTD